MQIFPDAFFLAYRFFIRCTSVQNTAMALRILAWVAERNSAIKAYPQGYAARFTVNHILRTILLTCPRF